MNAKSVIDLKGEQWKFGGFSHTCIRCDRKLMGGETYYSLLAGSEEVEEEFGNDEDKSDTRTEEDGESSSVDQESEQPVSETEAEREEEETVSLHRLDYCSDCWEEAPEEIYSYWKTELPDEEEEEETTPDRSTLVDVWNGFHRDETEIPDDEGEHDTLDQKVYYLITLMLMRKGYLSLEEQYRNTQGVTEFRLRVRGTEDETYRIAEPDISEEEVHKLRDRLVDVLGLEEADEKQEIDEEEENE